MTRRLDAALTAVVAYFLWWFFLKPENRRRYDEHEHDSDER